MWRQPTGFAYLFAVGIAVTLQVNSHVKCKFKSFSSLYDYVSIFIAEPDAVVEWHQQRAGRRGSPTIDDMSRALGSLIIFMIMMVR